MKMENINIRIRDFKNKLGALINESELPGFLVYEIFNNYTLQINNAIQAEIDAAEKQTQPTESE